MALTKEDLQAIAELMDNKLEPISKRLDAMQDDIDQIRENTDITRIAVNGLVAWTDAASDVIGVPYPVKSES